MLPLLAEEEEAFERPKALIGKGFWDFAEPTERLSSKALLNVLALNLAPVSLDSMHSFVLAALLTAIILLNRVGFYTH